MFKYVYVRSPFQEAVNLSCFRLQNRDADFHHDQVGFHLNDEDNANEADTCFEVLYRHIFSVSTVKTLFEDLMNPCSYTSQFSENFSPGAHSNESPDSKRFRMRGASSESSPSYPSGDLSTAASMQVHSFCAIICFFLKVTTHFVSK